MLSCGATLASRDERQVALGSRVGDSTARPRSARTQKAPPRGDPAIEPVQEDLQVIGIPSLGRHAGNAALPPTRQTNN